MIRKRKITIELFRDSATPDVSDDGVQEGIKELQDIYSGITLVDNGELIQIENPKRKTIDFKTQPEIPSNADMALVLSKRRFRDTRKGHYIYGRTYSHIRSRGAIALIDVVRTPHSILPQVVTHEGAHLFGVKEKGDHYDGQDHCTYDGCVMRKEVQGSPCICDECKQQVENYSQLIATDSRIPEFAAAYMSKNCLMAQAAFDLEQFS